jgi:hypothetical protein
MDWHIFFKVITGILVVPIAIMARSLWPWWVGVSLPTKMLSGVFVLPVVGLAAILSPWWNSY